MNTIMNMVVQSLKIALGNGEYAKYFWLTLGHSKTSDTVKLQIKYD